MMMELSMKVWSSMVKDMVMVGWSILMVGNILVIGRKDIWKIKANFLIPKSNLSLMDNGSIMLDKVLEKCIMSSKRICTIHMIITI
jgi:hypothetical protein